LVGGPPMRFWVFIFSAADFFDRRRTAVADQN